MKFAKTMSAETTRTLTQLEMDHASSLFTPIYSELYESRKLLACSGYSSDTGSESSDGSVVMSTRPEMRKPEMSGASIYMSGRTTHLESGISIGADLGLNTSDGFREIITPEISKVVRYTPFPDDHHEIQPDSSGDFFDRYSADPEEKKNRVRSRWSFFVSETLAIYNIVKYNEVVQAINWARWSNALVELDKQKAVPKNNTPGLLKKSMQVVATGAGLGLGAAATTVQTGLGAAATTVQTSWSLGKAVVGAVVNLGKKPDQTSPTRKHIRFNDSGGEDVREEVVVRSENQMQVDLQARSDREEPSPAPPAATDTGASTAPVPPPLPKPATNTGASNAPELLFVNELAQRTAKKRQQADEEAEKRKANVLAEQKRLDEAKRIADANRLYSLDFLEKMPWRQKKGEGESVQKLYMAHMQTKDADGNTHFPEGTANRSKDALIPDLLTLTKDQEIELPW